MPIIHLIKDSKIFTKIFYTLFYILFTCYVVSPLAACANVPDDADTDAAKYPFYIGGLGGYGTTTWQALIPPPAQQNDAMAMFVPIRVKEGGLVYGLFGGYELTPYFALEASYIHYPDAEITFDSMSLFAFNHNGQLSFTTHTDSALFMGKIMMYIPYTHIKAYSSFGVAEVHRKDEIRNRWRGSPAFGVGLNYNITPHVMSELGGIYSAGYGQSELDPVQDYIPFLYSIVLRIAYRFNL